MGWRTRAWARSREVDAEAEENLRRRGAANSVAAKAVRRVLAKLTGAPTGIQVRLLSEPRADGRAEKGP
jgi:hypothetical protein